jgi:cell fate regulator YaaT (PSP1 superfamily)
MPNRKPSRPGPDDQIVMVQFKGNRKGYFNNTNDLQIKVGEYCLVEADRGQDMGRVCYIGGGKPRWWKEASNQAVTKVADENDLQRLHDNRADEWDYYDICLEKIQQRKLNMQLVSVERQFDRNKITFFFTAEKRVDFRMLVKDLAAIFRTRIELRQIGVRDEAKMKGGLGICGRSLCCSTFLNEFSPITLKMAKTQQLPLSPSKLSGLCGRLRCCLGYEYNTYQTLQSRLPAVGAKVLSADGAGIVRKVNILKEEVAVYMGDELGMVNMSVSDLNWESDEDLPVRPPRGNRNNHDGDEH